MSGRANLWTVWCLCAPVACFAFGLAVEKHNIEHPASARELSFEIPIPMPEFHMTQPEPRWCDRRGWALEGSECVALDRGTIPLPLAGTCPGAYEIWRFAPGRPAICVPAGVSAFAVFPKNRSCGNNLGRPGKTAMTKKLCDVEDLVVWAAEELSRKRPGKIVTLPVFNVSRADREIVGRWNRPMGFPPMSPMFAAGFGQAGVARGDPPHEDALTVEAAIERLELTAPELSPDIEAELVDGLGFAVDVGGAVAAASRNAANLLLVHGRLASRPTLRLEPPEVSPKLAANGKPGVWLRECWDAPTFDDHGHAWRQVEVECRAKRKDLYPHGAYGVVEFTPDAQELVNERAEYAVWRAALVWLAEAVSGALESRAALPPRAAARPWMGERDGEPVRDLFGAGAERVYSGDEAATVAAERAAGRRRPRAGGSVYGWRPARPGKGMREA